MSLKIVRDDITNRKVTAIVNSANPKPIIGGGCEYSIYEKAGKQELLSDRIKIGNLNICDTAITSGYNLYAKYIIHVVSPIYDGSDKVIEQLKNCYINCLKLATQNNIKSIAFPLLSTGTYGYPKDQALKLALQTIQEYLFENELDVYIVVFDEESMQLTSKIYQDIPSYIDENYVKKVEKAEYYSDAIVSRSLKQREPRINRKRRTIAPNLIKGIVEECAPIFPSEIEEQTFQQKLFELMDEKELGDVEVYKKAGLNRKLFSKIRCNEHYHPQRKTAIALCIALELNYEETKDLLSRAGYALSPSNLFDVLISYFIQNKEYDLITINIALFEYTQQTL